MLIDSGGKIRAVYFTNLTILVFFYKFAIFDFANIKVTPYEGNKIYKPVDTDGDGICNVNCGDNSTKNDAYAIGPDFKYYHVIIPVLTGASDNAIDDLEFFFLVKK